MYVYMYTYIYIYIHVCVGVSLLWSQWCSAVLSGALHIPVIVMLNSATLDIVSYIRMYQKSVWLDDP